jgi:hypothetical protein
MESQLSNQSEQIHPSASQDIEQKVRERECNIKLIFFKMSIEMSYIDTLEEDKKYGR